MKIKQINVIRRIMEISTLYLLIKLIVNIMNDNILDLGFIKSINVDNIILMITIIGIFILIHSIRIFRIYILLVEDKKRLNDIIKVYLKSTFVNNILPFKLGEIYMVLSFGKELTSIYSGIVLVWLNRFFDALILISILTAHLLIYGIDSGYHVYILLVIFVLITILVFKTCDSTFRYFNRLILTKSKRTSGIVYLNFLDKYKEMFNDLKRMIQGRGVVLLLLSVAIWLLEFIMLKLTFDLLNISFNYSEFIKYINDAYMGLNNINVPNLIVIMLLFINILFIYILSIFKRSESK